MIVGPDWIWLHVPKCGGTAVEQVLRKAFRRRRDVVFDRVGRRSPVIWHHSLRRRREFDPDFDPSGKRVIGCIRRLPSWLLSRVHFEAERSKLIPTREQFLRGEFYESTGYLSKADRMIRDFDTPGVDDWIRVEHMATDIAAVFDLQLRSIPRVNEGKMPFIKDLSLWFTPDDLRAIYDANPVWAALERRVYGRLPIDDPAPKSASGQT